LSIPEEKSTAPEKTLTPLNADFEEDLDNGVEDQKVDPEHQSNLSPWENEEDNALYMAPPADHRNIVRNITRGMQQHNEGTTVVQANQYSNAVSTALKGNRLRWLRDKLNGLSLSSAETIEFTIDRSEREKVKKILTSLGEILLSAPTLVNTLYKDSLLTSKIVSRSQHVDISITAFSDTPEKTEAILDELRKLTEFAVTEALLVDINWYFRGSNGVQSRSITEVIDDAVHAEAYAYFGNYQELIEAYLESNESILILQGAPGLGKTRFIRQIIKEAHFYLNKEEGKLVGVGYTTDPMMLHEDQLFMDLMQDDLDMLVIEDVDKQIGSRSNGNDTMIRLLNASDGLVSNMNKKIILSTNLPNVNSVDEALLRPGRCHRILEFKNLSGEQALALASKITDTPEDEITCDIDEMTLADVYRSCNKVNKQNDTYVLEEHKATLPNGGFGFNN
jgi:hypothetical protein